MIDQIGGRKVVVTAVLLIVSVIIDRLTVGGISANLRDIIEILGVSFVGGNAAEHFSTNIGKLKNNKAPLIHQPQDFTHSQKAVEEIKAKIEETKAAAAEVKGLDELKTKLAALSNNAAINSQASSQILTRLEGFAQALKSGNYSGL